jgi:hypothetical protein
MSQLPNNSQKKQFCSEKFTLTGTNEQLEMLKSMNCSKSFVAGSFLTESTDGRGTEVTYDLLIVHNYSALRILGVSNASLRNLDASRVPFFL